MVKNAKYLKAKLISTGSPTLLMTWFLSSSEAALARVRMFAVPIFLETEKRISSLVHAMVQVSPSTCRSRTMRMSGTEDCLPAKRSGGLVGWVDAWMDNFGNFLCEVKEYCFVSRGNHGIPRIHYFSSQETTEKNKTIGTTNVQTKVGDCIASCACILNHGRSLAYTNDVVVSSLLVGVLL
jgi:hypothetical protein